jgi:hypothetical protein
VLRITVSVSAAASLESVVLTIWNSWRQKVLFDQGYHVCDSIEGDGAIVAALDADRDVHPFIL